MKKTVILSVAMGVLMALSANKANAQNFSAVNEDGDTLYYNIISFMPPLEVEVTSNGDSFDYGTYRGNIVIPETVDNGGNTYTVTGIGIFTFTSCDELTSVTIPNTVVSIGEGAFFYCDALASIDVEAGNPSYSSIDGILFNKSQNTLLQYPANKTGDDYTIPNTVTIIGDFAFNNCSKLTSVTIPNSVTTIGNWVFSICLNLTEIHLQTINPPALGEFAFSGVFNTITLYVPCGRKTTYENAAGWDYFNNIMEDTQFKITLQVVGYSGFVHIVQSSCQNDTAIIEAVAYSTSHFTRWSDGDTNNPRTIIVTSDTSFTAEFEIMIMYYVSVLVNDRTMGSVTGSGSYEKNTTAIIEAVANAGFRFVQWDDGDTSNPRSITVTRNISFTAEFEAVNAIADIDMSEINVFPNPATDNIYISLPENIQALFTLYDMQGKALIYQQVNGQETVSVNHLATGMYIYNIRTNKENYTGKIIKK
jgi:hypothetical protein